MSGSQPVGTNVNVGAAHAPRSADSAVRRHPWAMRALAGRYQFIDAIAIFLCALALRVAFNLTVEHRLCQFGDAFYYLSAGAQLLLALNTGSIWHLAQHPAAQGVLAMTSTSLVDRLLLDGPVFPGYLALMQWVLHINPAAPQFDAHAVQIGLFNGVLDSLSCALIYVCGRLAFNRAVAITAALLFAFYPPAIINTAVCYSEQFAYFLLLGWTACILGLNVTAKRHRPEGGLCNCWRNCRASCRTYITAGVRTSLAAAVGILSAMLVLAKPVFVLLPVVAGGVFAFTTIAKGGTRRRAYIYLVPVCLAGFTAVAIPWLMFTASITGKPTLLVNRAPAFNLYIGNDLSSDGFRTYPLPYIPAQTQEAAARLAEQARQHPLEFLGLELRKVSRLWAGPWNTFNYTFILSPRGQDIFHQFLLLAAAVGAAASLSANGIQTRRGRATLFIGAIVLVHFAYAAFEPISRYAMTAMPFVALLAAYALATRVRSRLAIALLCALVFIIAKRTYSTTAPLCALLFPSSPEALRICDACFWLATWASVFLLLAKAGRWSRLSAAIATMLSALTAGVLVADSLCNVKTLELVYVPNTADRFERTVSLSDAQGPFYVLADLATSETVPPAVVQVNGKVLGAPIPWWQVAGDNAELVKALSVEAAAAGTNVQCYRQWWLYPVPANVVRAGANAVELSLAETAQRGRLLLFGQYVGSSAARTIPSLRSASWTKAFAIIGGGDARLPQPVELASKNSSCRLNETAQRSEYHLYLLSCREAPQAPFAMPICHVPSHEVRGAYPPSFFPVRELPLPSPLPPGSRLSLHADVSSPRMGKGAVLLSVTGIDANNSPLEWTSLWQPGFVGVDKRPRSLLVSDALPTAVCQAHNLEAKLMISPFPTEWVFLRRKQAIGRSLRLDNLMLEVSAPVELDPRRVLLY